MKKPDVIFYGGTFDPIHKGHVEAVQLALREFPLARLIVIPAKSPPRSASQTKDTFALFEDRMAMAVVAFDEVPRVEISALEEDFYGPSYTIQTLERFKDECDGLSLAWMLGADQWLHFLKWKDPRKILEIASIIVIPRPAISTDDLISVSRGILSSLGLGFSFDETAACLLVDGGTSIFHLKQSPGNFSSTEARKLANEGGPDLKDVVPGVVFDYIQDMKLYQLDLGANNGLR